jgi:hypothetical protein
MGKKSTNAEIELRIATVYEMYLKGCSRPYIVRYGSEIWGITDRQIDEYLERAKQILKENFGLKYKEELLSKHLAQLDDLFVKNYTIQDFRECRNLIETKNKFLGLDAPTKQETKIEANFSDIVIMPKKNE